MIKKILKFAGLGFSILLIMATFVHFGFFVNLQKSLQNNFYDFASATPEIVIAAIDEKSLTEDELGPLPKWKRDNYGKAIDILNEQGAAAIGIDMTFPDQSTHGPADDESLRVSIKKADNVTLAARYYFKDKTRIAELPNDTIKESDSEIGWINVKLDADGFIREVPVFTSVKEHTYEAFSLQVARDYLKAEPVEYRIQNHTFPYSKDINIPVMTQMDNEIMQETHLMYINYFAEPGTYTQISMADLLKENFVDKKGNKINLKDKIVLIGPTAIDLQDYYLSPVSRGVRMPGVEIHANNIQTVISEKFLRDQSALSLWITLVLLIGLNIFLFSKLKIRYSIPIFFLECFGLLIIGIGAYEYRIFFNVIYPFLALILCFIGSFLLRFILAQSEKKFIEGAFGHYVNKTVVDQIMKDPKMLELGGAKREVTAFFSDIAGFTSISEKMDPGQLVQFLNGYLDAMTNIILENKGTLDKYEGDAIMAFWGAPLPLPDHAKNACNAALLNQKKLAEFRQECEKKGLPPIHIRIGINSGEVIAGNMGSENRFDYTIMGDNVNLASRLESINKQYGTELMISEYTYEHIKDDFFCRELDQIRVKGKEEPVRIYELVSTKAEALRSKEEQAQLFAQALDLYRKKNFMAAEQKFKAIADDPPSKVFAKRCAEFLKNPPDESWDGVYTFTTK